MHAFNCFVLTVCLVLPSLKAMPHTTNMPAQYAMKNSRKSTSLQLLLRTMPCWSHTRMMFSKGHNKLPDQCFCGGSTSVLSSSRLSLLLLTS